MERWLKSNLPSARRLGIVGEGKAAGEIAARCEPLVTDAQVFSKAPGSPLAARDAWSLIEEMDIIVALQPDGEMVEALISAANHFCQILVVGPVACGKRDINFYDSVHAKNLQVTFASVGGAN